MKQKINIIKNTALRTMSFALEGKWRKVQNRSHNKEFPA
ncbi:hypothetical protein B4123_2859 [Bacillus paralicheniformis]|nr:hypothetical protein B4123_2859 [Bacillus paralicheniformis]